VPHRIYLPFSNVPRHTNGRVHTLAALLLAQIYENILNILETQLLIKPAIELGSIYRWKIDILEIDNL
jgi:hypothetical protein